MVTQEIAVRHWFSDMSRVKHNILANAFGRGWSSLNFIVFTPVYLHLLGVEAYGVIGFFATLQSVTFLLDAGLSTSLNRELARSAAGAAGRSRDLVRTLEIIYFALAGAILLLAVAGSVPLSRLWLHGSQFSPAQLRHVLIFIGVALALQFPVHLFQSGLYGLQRQVLANGIASVFVTIRYAGAALWLWLYRPALEVFFGWFIAVVAVQTLVTRRFLWRGLPAHDARPRFNWEVLGQIRRFAAGMMGFGAATTLYQQADKVILSNLLPLHTYGYYMLASTVAGGLRILVAPVYNAFFPRMSQLVKAGAGEALRDFYHRGCQLIAVILAPAAWTVVFFAPQILRIWTGDPAAVGQAGEVLSLLALSVLVNALFAVPMGLQLAHGWVGLLFRLKVVMLILIVPVLIYATGYDGMRGAAAALVGLEAVYVGIGAIAMYRRLLAGDLGHWLWRDTLLPGGVSLMVVATGAGLLHGALETVGGRLWAGGVILAVLLAAVGAALATVPWVRRMVVQWLHQPLRHY